MPAYSYSAKPVQVTFVAAAGAANVTEVTLTVADRNGVAIPKVFHLNLHLSDAATGAGLTAVTASGAVAAKASNGRDRSVLTTKKEILIETLATGKYILSITDTAKTAFFVCASGNNGRALQVSDILTTANYG